MTSVDEKPADERFGGRITQVALDDLMARVGKERPARPWFRVLNYDVASRFAQCCLGSDNPLWIDEEYGAASVFGENVPAPMTEIVTSAADLANAGVGLPGVFSLHAGDEWNFNRRARLGEQLHATGKLASVELRPSKWGGEAVWQKYTFTYFDADGDEVSSYSRYSVRADRRKTTDNNKYEPRQQYRYSEAELEEIWHGYDTEQVRGADTRWIEDVSVGDGAGHVVKGPLLVMDMMVWWMGTGGPFMKSFRQRRVFMKAHPGYAIRDERTNVPHSPEDAHFDTDFANRSGVGGMYDIGRQRTASFVHLATNWCGDEGRLVSLKTRMSAPFYVGDTSWYRATVSGVDLQRRIVELSMTGTDQHGVQHGSAKAKIELPARTAAGAGPHEPQDA